MINRVVLVGRLTRDPELRKTNTGGKHVLVKKPNNADKETPLKPIMIADKGFDISVSSHLCCAGCKQPIINVWSSREYKPKYCHYCGQALDWSDNKQ